MISTMLQHLCIYMTSFQRHVTLKSQSKRLCSDQSQVRSTEYVAQASMDCYLELLIRDQVGPVKMKGRVKIATRIRSGIEISNENR